MLWLTTPKLFYDTACSDLQRRHRRLVAEAIAVQSGMPVTYL